MSILFLVNSTYTYIDYNYYTACIYSYNKYILLYSSCWVVTIIPTRMNNTIKLHPY